MKKIYSISKYSSNPSLVLTNYRFFANKQDAIDAYIIMGYSQFDESDDSKLYNKESQEFVYIDEFIVE